MDSDMDSINCTPEDIIESAVTATMNLLPAKSKEKYLKEYDSFMEWRIKKGINSFTERVLLAYFEMKSKMWKFSTLWSTYSKLKATIMVALIFGIAGALRREELYKMKCEDINETQNVLIITVPDTKTQCYTPFHNYW
ncbi:hypothetical protein NQ315_014539 [Exocentrus adspersus]|uniref:Uncharacterized protein n=1 Tax=Exocentrus adspersus TaxID=1586481 RepID=A0AAV8VLN9_9CUCU|nr:hypothetical protein NQ315_014539 [Exocentrus adspersus]